MSRSKKYLGGALVGLLALFAAAVVATPALAADASNTTQSVGGYTFTSTSPISMAQSGQAGSATADIVYVGSNATQATAVTIQGSLDLTGSASATVVPLTLSDRYAGTLTFTNATLAAADATSPVSQYLVDAQGGTLAMSGGSITGINANSAGAGGSALQVSGNATVTLTGTTVSGGKGNGGTGDGGAAVAVAGGTLTMTQGTVTGGEGADTQDVTGGVGITQSGGTATLNGVNVAGGAGKTANTNTTAGSNAISITGGTLDVQNGCTLAGGNAASAGAGTSPGGSAIASSPVGTPVSISLGSSVLTAGQAADNTGDLNVPAVVLGGSAETSLTFAGNASLTSNTKTGGTPEAGAAVLSVTNTGATSITFAAPGATFDSQATGKTNISAIGIGGAAGDVNIVANVDTTINGLATATAATISEASTASDLTFQGPGTLTVRPAAVAASAITTSGGTGSLTVAEGAKVVATSGTNATSAVTFAGGTGTGSANDLIVNGSLNAASGNTPAELTALNLSTGDLVVGPSGVLGAGATNGRSAITVEVGDINSMGTVVATFTGGTGQDAVKLTAGTLTVGGGNFYAMAEGVTGGTQYAINGNVVVDNATNPEDAGPTLTAIALSTNGASATALGAAGKSLSVTSSGANLETYQWLAQFKNMVGKTGSAVTLSEAIPTENAPATVFGFYGMANPESFAAPAAAGTASNYNSQWVQISPAPIEDIELSATNQVATTGTRLAVSALVAPDVTFEGVEFQPTCPANLLGLDNSDNITVSPEANATISGSNLVFSSNATGDTTTVSVAMPANLTEAYPDLGETVNGIIRMYYRINFDPKGGVVYVRPGDGNQDVPTGFAGGYLWTVPGQGLLAWNTNVGDSVNQTIPPVNAQGVPWGALVNPPTAVNSQEDDPFYGWFVADAEGNPTGDRVTTFDFTQNTNLVAVYQEPPAGEDVIVYRLYNQWSHEHLYTEDATEYNALIDEGWDDEGTAWVAPATSDTPVYRLFNPYNQDHYYCTSKSEADGLVSLGWRYDFGGGAAFYSAPQTGVPIYQLFNPYETSNTHLWTGDYNEYVVNADRGWERNGTAWYAVSL